MSGETSLRFNFLEGKNTVNPAMRQAATNAGAMATAMRVASAVATAGMVTLGAAVVSAAAHIVALGQSAIVASGAVALLPAAIGAAVGTAIAGKIVFKGLGEAWKATGQAATGGGGAAVDVAHRVEVANRGVRDAAVALADAQRQALAAQDNITRAREQASERLEDLSRSLRGARLDERSAVEALTDARKRLTQARASRDVSEIRQATIAYERAQLSLEGIRDTVEDLSKEQQEANEKGVEGSDEVVSAIERQEQAQRQLVHATERLADAQRQLAQAGKSGGGGGVDKAQQALAALAPSARDVITTLRAMGPAWSAASKNAQQATWVGVAADFNNLGSIYLPRVDGWLRRMGEGFNTAIRSTLGLAQTDKFARDVGTSLEYIDQAVATLAKSAAPFLNGFMQFVAVGSSFLPGIGTTIAGIATSFEKWAVGARESGRMQQWISDGLATLGQFWEIAKNVGASVLAIFKAGENTGTLDALVQGSAALRAWTESAEGQEKIKGFLEFLRNIFNDIVAILPAFTEHAGTLSNTLTVFGAVVGLAADNLDTIATWLPTLITLWIAYKTIQMGVNIVTLNGTVLKAAEIIAFWRHTAALNANTAALTAGDAVQKRSLISLAALKVAQGIQAVWTGIATAAQWAHNTAWYGFPLTWIIAAILAVIAVIVLIIMYHEEIIAWIGKAWDWIVEKVLWAWAMFKIGIGVIWGHIKDGVLTVHNWIVDKLTGVINFILGIKDKLASAGKNMWNWLIESFKGAINFLIKGWNALDFGINIRIPDWIPFVGGKAWNIPDIIPDLPYLDTGGRITQTGMAVVHKGEEVVTAAEVTRRDTSGGRSNRIVFGSDGSALGDLILEIVRKAVRDRGGDFDNVIFES